MKLLYISNMPSPYQLELFGHIARLGLAEEVILDVGANLGYSALIEAA